MSDLSSPRRGGPDFSKSFWRWLLLASLMLNLVVAGTVIGHAFGHSGAGGPGKGGGFLGQFVPGRFFADVAQPRRKELASVLRDGREQVDQLRDGGSANALRLADALEKQPYDAEALNTVVDSITTGPDSMSGKINATLKVFYAKLSPEERAALAKTIRDRAARGKQ